MKKIALLTGGPGYEREIALKSVELFKKYLKRPYDVYIFPEDLNLFLEKRNLYEKVIPVMHGEYGEDGRIQAFLDMLSIPYAGLNYFTNALCMNKREANIIASYNHLRVPQEFLLKKEEEYKTQAVDFSFPMIVKPNKGGSSCFTYKVHNFQELEEKITHMRAHISDDILIQEYILWDEYSISLVQGEVLEAIMFIEKNNPNDFFDFESKYESESGMRETFPELEKGLKEKLLNFAQEVKNIFSLFTGYARIDVIVRQWELYFLEVNTIPGSTEVSILPKAWKLSGRSLEEFIETIL